LESLAADIEAITYFCHPFLLANVIMVIALLFSLILKPFFHPPIAKIPIYIAIAAGAGIIYYGYKMIRGFKGAMFSLVGIITISEGWIILSREKHVS